MAAKALTCERCGAALPPPTHGATTCTYCGTAHHVQAPQPYTPRPETESWRQAGDLHTRLVTEPPFESVGVGVRHSTAAMASRDPYSYERGMWAVTASASSTYGGAWSPDALIGPPTVYPAYGDRGGAWAPHTSRSPREWVEVSFAHDVPSAALRVFETNEAGGVYAVVVIDDEGEHLVWASPPSLITQTQVLEVTLDPPRRVRRARIYLANDRGPSWTEIDAVGLLAAAPLPEAMRTKRASGKGFPVMVAVGAACVAVAVAVVALANSSNRSTPTPRVSAPRPSASLSAPPPTVSSSLPSSAVLWASGVTGYSSEFSTTLNSAQQVLGAPDVFPRHGDVRGAWAPRLQNAGEEWVAVRFPSPMRAQAIVWVETFNPGAVARIDDVSDPSTPVIVWEGAVTPPGPGAVVWTVELPGARTVSALRLVLDTSRVTGWNEIDAVGLIPAQ